MIKGFEGEQTTAKRLAQDLLAVKIDELVDIYDEYLDALGLSEEMSDREKLEVRDQLIKVSNRLRKVCGYEPRYQEVLQ